MMARWLCTTMVSALLLGSGILGSGCCCVPCGSCGPGGQPRYAVVPCLPCLPKPIVWNGCNNECGACPGQSCADFCGSCGGCGILSHGLFPWLGNCLSCNRGCNGIYINEWISDPPDCCDPCDKCYGQFTGQQGYCCLGPCQRLLAAFHGYRYCPRPNCGPWCPIFGHCGQGAGPCGCGDAGCAGCGGGQPHGADIYYGGAPGMNGAMVPNGMPIPPAESTSIMEENWDAPSVKPTPGKPIHSAQQPPRQMSRRAAPPQAQPMSRPASKYSTVVGAGVRQANYEP